MKPLTSLLLGASVLLVGCSSTYGSREEAFIASNEWKNDGREFEVVDVPTDAKVEYEINEAKQWRNARCETYKRYIRTGYIIPDKPLSFPDIQKYKRFVREECHPGTPLGVSKETLTKRETKNTRTCNHEEDTRQWTCKEYKVSGDEIMKDKWDETKPTYSYFRY